MSFSLWNSVLAWAVSRKIYNGLAREQRAPTPPCLSLHAAAMTASACACHSHNRDHRDVKQMLKNLRRCGNLVVIVGS